MSDLDNAHRDGVVIGLAKEADAPVARLDIDEMLLNQPDTFNLMVIALLEVMCVENLPWKTPDSDKFTKDDKFSWFQIASIHGLPLKPWDGVEPPEDPNKKPRGPDRYNYCLHGTPAFETWHRPYLAMLEQTLYRQVQKVAKRFTDSGELSEAEVQQYQKAAKQFRLPYVDYFRPRGYQRMIPGVTDYDDPKGTPIGGPKGGGLYPRWRGTHKMIKIPYDYSLPQIFTLPRIVVKTLPKNETQLVQNPFFSFKLPEDALTPGEWQKSQLDMTISDIKGGTLRYGSNKPRSVTQMNDNLCKLHEDQLRMTLSLFDKDGPYRKFAAITTSGANGIPEEFRSEQGLSQSAMGSLESVHNDFHVYYGGFVGTRMWDTFFPKDPKDPKKMPPEYYGQPETWAGHMTSVPVAAFDPVFWIHHVQIDRLFAIWQAVNPNTWFDDLKNPDDKKLKNANLYPLRKSKTAEGETFWTPDQARYVKDLGYTYPDLETEDQSPEAVRERFYDLYAWSRRRKPNIVVGVHQLCPPEMEPLDVSKAQAFRFGPGSTEDYIFEKLGPKHDPQKLADTLGFKTLEIPKEIDEEPAYAWFIDDAVERLCLNGSFTIFYFIDVGGVVGDTGGDWVRMPGFVGLTHIFTASSDDCANCYEQSVEKKIVTSTTPITSLLLDYVELGKLKSMKPEDVKPFLEQFLKWRIQTVGGEVVDPEQLSKNEQLRISVSHTESSPGGIAWMGDDKAPAENHMDIIKTIIEKSKAKDVEAAKAK